MGMPVVCECGDVPGDSTLSGFEGLMDVLEFNHQLFQPVDPDTGMSTSIRKHDPVSFVTPMGQCVPIFAQKLCTNTNAQDMIFKFLELKDAAYEVHSTITLTGVKVVNCSPRVSHLKVAENNQRTHECYVEVRYQTITWEQTASGGAHTDSWSAV